MYLFCSDNVGFRSSIFIFLLHISLFFCYFFLYLNTFPVLITLHFSNQVTVMKNIFLILGLGLTLLPSVVQATPSSPASLDDIPLIGRYTISETIGADRSQYHAQQEGNKQIFHNQEQKLSALVDDRGLEINNSSHSFTLNLSQYGYGETLSEVPEATLHPRKNRVELLRGPITEWYVNGPLGLQQGFTLSQPPHQANQEKGSELHLTLAMVGLRGKLSQDGMNMVLSNSSNKTVMQYGGLTAFDANGLELPARLAATGNTLHIYVDDRTADYPIVIDPLFQNARLTQDREANDEQDLHLGWSVAINNDTVVVGARGFHDIIGTNRGTVYVYTKSDTGWADMTQSARLWATDGEAGDSFGISVAINSADNIIVVGASGHDAKGKVYLFIKAPLMTGGSRWVDEGQDATLTNFSGTISNGSEFGRSVAIDSHSGAIVVGAPGLSSWKGGAYVFVEPTNGWATSGSYTPTATLAGSGTTFEFGKSVAIDNNQIVVGAPGESNQGAAYFFKSSSWNANPEEYDMKLVAGDISSQDSFGYDVAVNGSTIAVGAPSHTPSGAVYLFNIPAIIPFPPPLRTHTTKLLPESVVEAALFGRSVAMNDTKIVVGTPYQAIDGRQGQGQIHLFSKGAGWPGTMATPVEITENVHLTSSDGAIMDNFGWSVAIATDNSLASGAYYSNTNGVLHQGAAYVFNADSSTEAAKLTARQSLWGDRFGTAVAVSGDTIVVGAHKHNTRGLTDQGAAYVFTKPSNNWMDMTPVALLFSGDGAVGDNFGSTLAISGDTIVVGAPYHDISGDYKGAAYIFAKPAGGWNGKLSHTAKLSFVTGTAGDHFGDAVAIDGNTVIIGAPDENSQGATHLFAKPAGQAWTDTSSPTVRLVASDVTADDRFGDSVSISNNTVVVGAPRHDTNGNGNQGAAYVFVEPAVGWENIWTDIPETAKLSISNGYDDDTLGESVAISGDTIVTGAPWHQNQGAAFIFHKPGTSWTDMTTATAKLTPSDSYPQQQFGYSVAIAANTVICSTWADNTEQGAAYLFKKTGAAWTDSQESEKLIADDAQDSDWLGAAIATDGKTVIAGAPGVEIDLSWRQGAAYLFDLRKAFPWAMFLPAIVNPKQ
jgi:FG-GAP repeat